MGLKTIYEQSRKPEENLIALIERQTQTITTMEAEAKAKDEEIATLKSEKQNLKQKVLQLNEQIVKLNNSDLELSKSRQLYEDAKREKDEASRKLKTARELTDSAEKTIEDAQYRAEREAASAQHMADIKLERDKGKLAWCVLAFAGYALLLTVLWGGEHWQTLKTLPQWFISRYAQIAHICAWTVDKAKGSTIALIIAIIASVGVLGALGYGLYRAYKFIAKEIRESRRNSTALFKLCLSGSVFLAFLPLSVLLVELTDIPCNFFTVWQISGIAAAVGTRYLLQRF